MNFVVDKLKLLVQMTQKEKTAAYQVDVMLNGLLTRYAE